MSEIMDSQDEQQIDYVRTFPVPWEMRRKSFKNKIALKTVLGKKLPNFYKYLIFHKF